MPHIHTIEGQHDLTTSAFIIRSIDDVPHLLLHMHKKHGKLLQPGGHVELHESPWQAIAHELVEETGYSLHELQVLQPAHSLATLPGITMHPVPSSLNTHAIEGSEPLHHHTDLAYTFLAAHPPAHTPHTNESQDLRWLTLQDLELLTPSEMYPDTIHLCRHSLTAVLGDWTPVPSSRYSL